MSYLRLFFICILFLACEDKKTSQQTVIKKDTLNQGSNKPKQEIPKKPEREFPRLDSKNAMDFFLEYDKDHKENKVRITTTMGEIDVQLFDETRFHRSNFIFLTKQNYFNGTQFHRVVKNFIIQGGSTDNPKIGKRRRHIGKYLLPPDTKRGFRHHRGIISMPSSEIENAYKLASPYEFFIVQNPKGAYHLDGKYTAFGKVIKGMDVVDKINSVKTDRSDWPITNIYIEKVEILE